jgi:hypothetical protein
MDCGSYLHRLAGDARTRLPTSGYFEVAYRDKDRVYILRSAPVHFICFRTGEKMSKQSVPQSPPGRIWGSADLRVCCSTPSTDVLGMRRWSCAGNILVASAFASSSLGEASRYSLISVGGLALKCPQSLRNPLREWRYRTAPCWSCLREPRSE